MTVRTLSAGAARAALVGDVLLDCGAGILAAAAFGGVSLAGVRHLLLSGIGPQRFDPALAAAPPASLDVHPPGSGPVRLRDGTATELAPGVWLLDTGGGLVLHAPDPLPAAALDALGDRPVTLTTPLNAGLLGHAARTPVNRVLVTGGSRSGKSAFAEGLLAGAEPALYVATGAIPDGSDPEWAERVRVHRERRPASWSTVETLDIAAVLATDGPRVLVDGLGGWLARVMDGTGIWRGRRGAHEALATATAGLLAAWQRSARDVVAVTDEVGSGVVPGTASGRRFRDELGRLNAAVAARSDEVWLVTAGIGQRLR